MNLDAERAIVTVLILLAGFAGVLAPRCFQAGKSPVLSYLNLFSSGVLMAAALVHLLNESSEAIAVSPLAHNAEGEPYAWNFFFCTVFFYIMFFFERILIKCVAMSEFSKINQSETAVTADPPQAIDMDEENGDTDYDHGHDHTHGYGHEHGHDGKLMSLIEQGNLVGAGVLMFGLSLHSIIEGLALGDAKSTDALTSLVVAILSHKFLAAFALGMPFKNADVSLRTHILFAFLFSIMTPLGALIGWGAGTQMEDWVSGILLSMAAGTFLYVAIFEIMIPEFGTHDHGELWANTLTKVDQIPADEIKEELMKALFVLAGFGAMSVLGIWA